MKKTDVRVLFHGANMNVVFRSAEKRWQEKENCGNCDRSTHDWWSIPMTKLDLQIK
jgi:hypothetical protein